jgi:hypothetical protein
VTAPHRRPLSPAPATLPNPLNAFPSSLSFFHAKPESEPWPQSGLRDFLTSRRRKTSPPASSAAVPQPLAVPRHPIKIRRSKLDLDQGQINRYRSTLGHFAHKPRSFIEINPQSTEIQKNSRIDPFFLLFKPLSSSKIEPTVHSPSIFKSNPCI